LQRLESNCVKTINTLSQLRPSHVEKIFPEVGLSICVTNGIDNTLNWDL
jgi:hypothetical protein